MPKASELGVVSVVDVVTKLYGLDCKSEGKELKTLCPLPNHDDSKPSCSINSESGYWHCFPCGKGGDLADLGAVVLRREREDIEQMLFPSSTDAILQVIANKLTALQEHTKVRRKRQEPLGGPYDDGPLTYMRNRGFRTETLQRYGVRFVPEQQLLNQQGKPFTLRSSMGIPIRDENERLLAWCYRRTNSSPSWQPKYLYDREVGHLWFGIDLVKRETQVHVVEGPTDTMWLDQNGFPALGLLGSGMTGGKMTTRSKIMRLQRFKSLVLFGDRDHAGATWVKQIGQTLGDRMPIWIVTWPRWISGGDPQELVGCDLEIMLSRAQLWTKWRLRHSA